MVKPKITMYYDVVRYSRIPNRANESPYSFMGVEVLKRYRDFWGGRIEVDFVPFFLGGIMAGTGNRPPAFVPARSGKLMGMPKFRRPKVFPIQSYKQMRIVCALKDAADRGDVAKDTDLKIAERLWKALWTEEKDTSDEAVMQTELEPLLPGGWDKWKYAISDPTMKKKLSDFTQEALDGGAFGAPWWVITNANGETERFFGSDRWDHVCDFLGEKFLGYFPGEGERARL